MVRSIAAGLLMVSVLAAQTTFVSGGGGALQAAFDAAAPGDTLVVRAGRYDALTAAKGVSILCDPGVTLAAGAVPPLRIVGLPVGHAFVLRGCAVDAGVAPGPSIQVSNCLGTVVLDGVADRSLFGGGTIASCAGTVLVRGFASDRPAFLWDVDQCAHVGFLDAPAQPCIEVRDSSLQLSDCTTPVGNQHNLPALTMTRSTVAVSRCQLFGNSSLAGIFLPHPAVVMRGGDLTLAGSALAPPSFSTFSPGIDVMGGRLRISSDTQIAGAPPILGSASVRRNLSLPTVVATGVPSGSVLQGRAHAEVGSFVATLFGAPAAVVGLPFGAAWIDPNSAILDLGPVPGSGFRSLSVAVPLLPVATPITLQAVAVAPGGGVLIGPPQTVVIN